MENRYGGPPQDQGGYGPPPQGQGGYGPPPQGQGGYAPPPQGQGGYAEAGPPVQGQGGYGASAPGPGYGPGYGGPDYGGSEPYEGRWARGHEAYRDTGWRQGYRHRSYRSFDKSKYVYDSGWRVEYGPSEVYDLGAGWGGGHFVGRY
jgi:hypothetical protein